jgi:hypothetical protein
VHDPDRLLPPFSLLELFLLPGRLANLPFSERYFSICSIPFKSKTGLSKGGPPGVVAGEVVRLLESVFPPTTEAASMNNSGAGGISHDANPGPEVRLA